MDDQEPTVGRHALQRSPQGLGLVLEVVHDVPEQHNVMLAAVDLRRLGRIEGGILNGDVNLYAARRGRGHQRLPLELVGKLLAEGHVRLEALEIDAFQAAAGEPPEQRKVQLPVTRPNGKDPQARPCVAHQVRGLGREEIQGVRLHARGLAAQPVGVRVEDVACGHGREVRSGAALALPGLAEEQVPGLPVEHAAPRLRREVEDTRDTGYTTGDRGHPVEVLGPSEDHAGAKLQVRLDHHGVIPGKHPLHHFRQGRRPVQVLKLAPGFRLLQDEVEEEFGLVMVPAQLVAARVPVQVETIHWVSRQPELLLHDVADELQQRHVVVEGFERRVLGKLVVSDNMLLRELQILRLVNAMPLLPEVGVELRGVGVLHV
mmetsp:Transcript_30380/g.83691  ORF Transcript_30380/g.83691 Transcript_30380/m.83691 type:complete len:374 (+) Transcript_30380:1374-2495(+)